MTVNIAYLTDILNFKKNQIVNYEKRLILCDNNLSHKSEYEKNEIAIAKYETMSKIYVLRHQVERLETELRVQIAELEK